MAFDPVVDELPLSPPVILVPTFPLISVVDGQSVFNSGWSEEKDTYIVGMLVGYSLIQRMVA